MGLSYTGISCLLTAIVNGCRRVPLPPASIIPFILVNSIIIKFHCYDSIFYLIARHIICNLTIIFGPRFIFRYSSTPGSNPGLLLFHPLRGDKIFKIDYFHLISHFSILISFLIHLLTHDHCKPHNQGNHKGLPLQDYNA